MKKFTAALCTVLLLIGAVLVPGAAAAGPALANTRAYCIMDADTGLVLAQQNMDEELHPASITKVMTLGLACEKAQGDWDDVKLTVTHEDVYSLAGTDSSHIALLEGEEVPLVDALYATQMASANDGANLLAEYFGGGTIADGVAAMNAQVEELGLAHTHFANPHGISDEDHYTSCYDMAQILRWALQQPGFEEVFTRNQMYTMQSTNIQPVTRYFSQQDKIRIGSSRYHIGSVLGSKLGYTNTARYSYVCLAEQDGVRLICVTMQSQLSTDKYNDMRTLLDYAFATYKSYTQLPGGTVTAQLAVAGGGQSLGAVTVADPGVKLLLAEGLSAQDVTVDLELPEQYLNVGIAEQNCAGVAAGLATCGKIPFIVTYAAFGSMRMVEMIRQEICYPHLNVKLACSHGGVTPANDGASHQAIEDMGILRTIPNMTVIMPADYYSARKLVRAAAEFDGPVYLRFTRDAIPVIYDEEDSFVIGKAKQLRQGKDVAIIANGDTVRLAIQAA